MRCVGGGGGGACVVQLERGGEEGTGGNNRAGTVAMMDQKGTKGGCGSLGVRDHACVDCIETKLASGNRACPLRYSR